MTTFTGSSTITLTGASRANYEFTLYPWPTSFRAVCAVYAIFAKRVDGHHVLYIGQTGNCAERFEDHHKAWCFRSNGVTHIGLLIENSEQRRLAIEADLIASYNPPCNG
jgi:hypothetical protein